MRYGYRGFIPETIAPKGATKIVVCNSNDDVVSEIPLSNLTRPTGIKRFSIGLISDIHMDGTTSESYNDFNRALSYFEERECNFCCHAGDMTNTGFWDSNLNFVTTQFGDYKSVCDAHPDLPVYGICGNHENYFKVITETLDELNEYAGIDLYYSIPYQNDVFIFVCQPISYTVMNLTQLQWLYETLETNRNKRCHVFVHIFLPNDSGNTKNSYNASFGPYANQVMAMLNHYKNAILYHGHSHIKFQYQELDKATNFTKKNGFPSVHIPSASHCMDVVLQGDGTYKRVVDYSSSQGYIVDFYDEFIIYNGIDFSKDVPSPHGTFIINTPLHRIEAGTFVDITGIITT